MPKNPVGNMVQEPKESQPPSFKRVPSKTEKNETDKSPRHQEETKKNNHHHVNFDTNIVVRLKATKPNKESLVNRLAQLNVHEDSQLSPRGKKTNVLQESNKYHMPDHFSLARLDKKNPSFHHQGLKRPLANLSQRNIEKDQSAYEMTEGTNHALTTRDSHQNGLLEEIQVRKSQGPTIRDLKAFYPKAKAHIRETNEEDAEELRFDKVAVEDLDRWDNGYKQSLRMKNEHVDERRLRRNPKPEKTYEPQLNSHVINMIAKSSTEHEPLERNATSLLIERTKGPYKTTESISRVTNKKILNMIVYNKAKSVAMRLDRNALAEQTDTLQEDTISNFKNLQNNLGPLTTGTLIDYDTLLEKLYNAKFPPNYLFDFTLEKKEKEDEELTLKFSLQEKGLLQKFQETIVEIHSKKDIQGKIRIDNHELVTKIKGLQAENEYMGLQLIQYEEKIRKTRQQNPPNPKNARRKAREVVPSSKGIEEFRELEKKREETAAYIQENNKEIHRFQQELKRYNERLEEIDEEIRELKLFKSEARLELKNLYLRMLKNERQLLLSYAEREDTLVYIIKQLWKINEEVTEDLFPSFLEKSFLKFLFKVAQLDYERDQIEHYKQSEEYKMFKQLHELKNDTLGKKKAPSLLKTPFHIALAEVKTRINKLKKGLLKRKKPVFAPESPTAGSGKNLMRWEDMSEIDQSMQGEFTNDLLNFHNRIDLMLDEIKQQIIKLREEEANKLFEKYTTKGIDEKLLRYLSKILIILFGKLDAEKFFMKFVRMKQHYEQKTAQNHTFKFESIRASNALKAQSQSSFGLMMSHSTTFRKYKSEVDNLSTKAMKTVESRLLSESKTERPVFPNWNVNIDREETQEANYRYNSLYNYFPSLQNTDDMSSYFISPGKRNANTNINKSGFASSRGATSQGDRGALSSRGTNLMLTQQVGTLSTRGYSSQRLREFSSQGQRVITPQSILNTSRVNTEGSLDRGVRMQKKVVINETPSVHF